MSTKLIPTIVGNWKMNGTRESAVSWMNSMNQLVSGERLNVDIVVAVPFTLLSVISDTVVDTNIISLSGQDCSEYGTGAHTGDTSAEMLVDVGCKYVITGHSERRANHYESNTVVKNKAEMAIKNGLIPIICIGESKSDRESKQTLDIIKTQLLDSMPQCHAQEIKIVIAYEPVWAIGTGVTPELGDIIEVHTQIQNLLHSEVGIERHRVQVLYGGSVKATNSADILNIPEVDGCLVGGASLNAEEFWSICRNSNNN